MGRYYYLKKITNAANIFPFSFLFRLYYQLAYVTAKWIIITRSSNTQVWARNSYQTRSYSPGTSDIDLTILSSNQNELKKSCQRWKRLKLFFPLFHELNAYSQNEFSKFIPYANYFEIKRDPQLFKIYYESLSKQDIEAQAICFLLRQFQSDFENLKRHEHLRKEKWQRIFDNISAECPRLVVVDHNSIHNSIDQTVSKWVGIDIAPSHYLARFALEDNHSTLKDDLTFQATFPTLWACAAIKFFDISGHNVPTPTENQKLLHILSYQIYWEIWGLFGQRNQISTEHHITKHLSHMQAIIEKVNLTQLQESGVKGIRSLAQLF